VRKYGSAVTGGVLQFDRAGRQLLIGDADAVSVVDVTGGGTTRIARAGVRALAGFGDQVWLVVGETLYRHDANGRSVGEPVTLPFAAEPVLIPVPHGPSAALWPASPATIGVIDDLGQIAQHEHPAADAIVPITGRRALIASGARVQLPAGLSVNLAPGSTVIGGAVLADGKFAALVIARAGQRHVATIAIGSGQLVARCDVPADASLRIAGRRAVVVVQREREVEIHDVRTGRCAGSFAVDRDVEDLAIDPDGKQLALRHGADVDVMQVADRLRQTRTVAAAKLAATVDNVMPLAIPDGDEPPVQVDDAPPAPVAVEIAAPVPARRTPLPSRAAAVLGPLPKKPLVALDPRPPRPAIDRDVALGQLDRELRGVMLWALCAIADAWDTRRLGYGNESQHPYELEVAAILGMNQGFAVDHLAAARQHLAEHEAAVAGDPQWRAPGTPLGDLIAELELDTRAADVLLVIAAASLWGEVARLYGILANDPGRPLVDELLVQQMLAGRHARHDLAAELDPRARLVRLGVVRTGAKRARPFADLSIDPVILDRLRGQTPDLGAATAVRGADTALDAFDAPRDVLVAAIDALARPARGPARIAVRGRSGSGRRTLLAALAGLAGRELAVIDAQILPRTVDAFQLALEQSLRGAHLAGHLPCIAGLDRIAFDDHSGRDVANDVIRTHPGAVAVIAGADAPVPFPPGHVAIDLPVLPETTRRAVWLRALGDAGLDVADVDGLAARYRVGPGVIHRAIDAARSRRAVRDGDVDVTDDVEHYIRQTRDAALGQHARRVEHLASWSSVVLPPDVLDSLRELIGRVRYRRTVFEDWGMGAMLSTARGITALFQGQPGTGKTMVAGVIARELGLDLYQVDLSKVMSKWIGETERNLAAIFDAAEDGQVVLLFDEADSLFAKRTEVRSSNDRYANLEVNYLLQRLDAFEGIAVLTTNFGGSIDPALKRRMSFRLSFPFPDEETREQLWRAHLPPELPIDGTLALGSLAHKYQLSGGYIRNACLRAAFLAAQEESSLQQRHLERAVALEFSELGKLSSGGAIS
jgi:hypothetical protein